MAVEFCRRGKQVTAASRAAEKCRCSLGTALFGPQEAVTGGTAALVFG
jgi:hypothetical protein